MHLEMIKKKTHLPILSDAGKGFQDVSSLLWYGCVGGCVFNTEGEELGSGLLPPGAGMLLPDLRFHRENPGVCQLLLSLLL